MWEHKIIKWWRAMYLYGVAPRPPSASGLVWSLNMWVDGRCSPTVNSNIIYTGIGSELIALNTDTRLVLWRFQSGATVSSSPAFVNNTLFFGNENGNVYAVNAATGAKLWEFPTGDMVVSSPAVADGVVYVGSYDGKLYAIE